MPDYRELTSSDACGGLKDAFDDLAEVGRRMNEALSRVGLHMEENTRARLRAVSVKAKNLSPGDLIQWPYDWGQGRVNGWSRRSDHVILTMDDGKIATIPSEDRVRVYR
jgi:hypothetical protein